MTGFDWVGAGLGGFGFFGRGLKISAISRNKISDDTTLHDVQSAAAFFVISTVRDKKSVIDANH